MSRLINQLRAQRQSWVDVAPGKRVQIMRPPESEIGSFLRVDDGRKSMVAELDQVVKFTAGWDGITEADILGASVGGSDAVAFEADLWREMVADRGDWLKLVAQALLDAIVKHFESKAQAEKN
jgi:hypothetical protein